MYLRSGAQTVAANFPQNQMTPMSADPGQLSENLAAPGWADLERFCGAGCRDGGKAAALELVTGFQEGRRISSF